MILERSDHPLPAGDALLMTHLEDITDRLRDLKFVIWIDYKCARQLLSCTRKLRKDQDPRVCRILRKRIQASEAADVTIIQKPAVEALINEQKIASGSNVILARSGIGAAVRQGAPKPDISSVDALKRTLLAAKSVAYCTETHSFTTPFIATSGADPHAVIKDIWPKHWVLPFSIHPLGNLQKQVPADLAKVLWPILKNCGRGGVIRDQISQQRCADPSCGSVCRPARL